MALLAATENLCTYDDIYMCYLSMYKWPQIYVLLVVITTISSPHSSMYKWPQIYVLLVYVQMTTDICVTCLCTNDHRYMCYLSMYKWPQIYVLLVYGQMTTDICVSCRNHNHVLSSFVYVQMTTDICVTCLCTNDHRYMCYLS
jgi:hypothetical protein